MKLYVILMLWPFFLNAQEQNVQMSEDNILSLLGKNEVLQLLKGNVSRICTEINSTGIQDSSITYNLSDSVLPNTYVLSILSKMLLKNDSCIGQLEIQQLKPNYELGRIKGRFDQNAVYRVYLVEPVDIIIPIIVVQEDSKSLIFDRVKFGEVNYFFVKVLGTDAFKIIGFKVQYN